MTTKPQELIDILADQAAELDELVADHLEQYGARVRELIGDPNERDFDVWDLYEADVDLTTAEFEEVPRQYRDSEWAERLAAMVLASRMQALSEILLRRLLGVADSHGEKSAPLAVQLTEAEAVDAARLGISEDAISVAARNRVAARGEAEAAQAAQELGAADA